MQFHSVRTSGGDCNYRNSCGDADAGAVKDTRKRCPLRHRTTVPYLRADGHPKRDSAARVHCPSPPVIRKRACDLLLTTQLSLKRIAHLSGFKNEYYFGRVFKKHTNLPPGAYRKRFSPEINSGIHPSDPQGTGKVK